MPNSKTTNRKPTGRASSSSKDQVKPTKLIPKDYDKPKQIAIAGFVGLILTYIVGSRALNTGSYWEYLFTVVLVVVSIRLFIRSIRLK
jgi:hypothetical protein